MNTQETVSFYQEINLFYLIFGFDKKAMSTMYIRRYRILWLKMLISLSRFFIKRINSSFLDFNLIYILNFVQKIFELMIYFNNNLVFIHSNFLMKFLKKNIFYYFIKHNFLLQFFDISKIFQNHWINKK